MTTELVFLLIALWIVLGLVDAWVLHQLGHSDWRWTVACVLTGPLSLSFVYDQRVIAEPDEDNDSPTHATPEIPVSDANDEGEQDRGCLTEEWPRDDPEGRFVLQGYRGLADH